MNLDGIIQALIVAGITAALTGYVNTKVMEAKMNGLREKIKGLEGEIKTIRERLHEWAPHIGWVDQERRWGGQDRRQGDK